MKKSLLFFLSIWLLSGGKLLWRVKLPGRIFYTSPVVHNGLVYQAIREGRVFVIDLYTGKILGFYRIGGWIKSTPVVYEDKVFAVNDRGIVVALSSDLKTLYWKVRLSSGFYSSFYRYDDKLFVGSIYERFFALSLTGQKLWEFKTKRGIYNNPAVLKDLVCFGDIGGYIYCLTLQGKPVCRTKVSPRGMTTPVVFRNRLLFASGSKIFSYDPKKCAITWDMDLKKFIMASPIIDKDKLIVCPHDDIVAIDLRKKKIIWRFRTLNRIVSSPSVASGRLFVASTDSHLYALELSSGKLLWKKRLKGPTYSWPFVYESRLLISDIPGNLWCFDLQK